MQKGVAHIAVLALIALTAFGIIVLAAGKPPEVTVPVAAPEETEATATPTPTLEPTPEPTEAPTPTPTPTPTPEATATPTTTPTQAPASVTGTPGDGHSRYSIGTEVGTFLIDVVTINKAGATMITDTANGEDCVNDCFVMPLADFVTRSGGYAGINGSYFCPSTYGECAGKSNSFDFPVYNSPLGKWINGSNLFWNNRSILYQNGSTFGFNRNANSFGGGLTAGIVNHPGVLDGGQVIADQFGLSAKQGGKGTKSGIGYSDSKIFLVVARGVSATDLGHVFKSLGATHALNLDGGGSSALWFGGYKVGPGRNIPNAVVFK